MSSVTYRRPSGPNAIAVGCSRPAAKVETLNPDGTTIFTGGAPAGAASDQGEERGEASGDAHGQARGDGSRKSLGVGVEP